MSDRRRRIDALRAKADSTTFPAEAAALRAKADEMAAQEPAPSYTPPDPLRTGVIGDWRWAPGGPNVNIRVHGNFFEEMGGIRVTWIPPWAHVADDAANNRVRVTDVNGRTYWITVE